MRPMKYTIAESAKIVGSTRQTIYRHIESKPITIVKDDNGNQLIEASELLRIYGNSINFDAINENGNVTDKVVAVTSSVTESDNAPKELIAEEKLNSANQQIAMLKEQMNRERELLEGQLDTLKSALEKSQDSNNKTVALLEDKTSKENDAQKWQKSIDAIESRVANQEIKAQEEKERAQKILRQNQALKKALDAEKNKSFFQKLFG
jgi:hypothetical protein